MANRYRTLRNQVPQTVRANGDQVKNRAGGFAFELRPWQQLDRFLILGTDANSYYAGAHELTRVAAKAVEACLTQDPVRTVARVVEISLSGRAPRQAPTLFALSMALSHPDPKSRRAAEAGLGKVCRTASQLFELLDATKGQRGWGRGLRSAVGRWYTEMPLERLAMQGLKYRRRHGFSHRDVMRLAHPSARSPEQSKLFAWLASKDPQSFETEGLPTQIEAQRRIQGMTSEAQASRLIRQAKLTHEMLPSELLAKAQIWQALLPDMPMGAMVRNLGRMTANGALRPESNGTQLVVSRLLNAARLQRARLHPVQLLSAWMTYRQGHGQKGRLKWTPVPALVAALEQAFYASFQHQAPTGKRSLLALDVSGSMGMFQLPALGALTPRTAAAAMAMVTARLEQEWQLVAFSTRLRKLDLRADMPLEDVLRLTSNLPFGATDCAAPMIWAQKQRIAVDTFVVYTDSETFWGNAHPHVALKNYRQAMGIDAKLMVVGMVANQFSIADPKDPGVLDVVGFDSAAPRLMADFSRGGLL